VRFSQYREEEVGISLTPLIDVVFLLLIFFMVSTTFSKESQLNLRLPTSDLPLETTLEEEVILISISEQGQYVLKRGNESSDKMYNGSDAVELSEQLQVLVSGWDDPVVIIRADRSATHQSVMTALDAAQRAGLFKLTFSMQKQP
tara:strand:+ start:84 stop:518 length:435 start_codon:yes stop_codon:yes gene_type:complete